MWISNHKDTSGELNELLNGNISDEVCPNITHLGQRGLWDPRSHKPSGLNDFLLAISELGGEIIPKSLNGP